jgi:outer membrane protein assembly factor BamD
MTVVTPRVPVPPFSASRLGPVARLCLALAFTLALAACGTSGAKYDKTANWSAEQLYTDAKQEMDAGNWKDARDRLTAVESRYPFGIYAQQALMNLAYVNWKDGENEQALAAIDRFQQLYPNHPGTDYMLYLKGLINFTPASAFMTNLTGQDPSERDPKGLRASYDAFNELIKRYPDSKYTPDARLRVAWLVNAIAMNEVHVARYYYERGAYVAAANRAQTVITDFQGAPASEDALYILYKSYEKLNMPQLEKDAKRVLDANYPNSKLPSQGFTKEKVWWDPTGWL